ncbi:MAG: glycosyltransferase [Bacteroidales bacterium]|nr:glycosyltransferase [Bacteroidales bacterium]
MEFKNIIVRMHGSDLYEELYGGYIPFREKQIQRVTRVYTISEFGKKYLMRSYPEYSLKFDLARLGTNDHGLNPWKDRDHLSYTIVSCASITYTKRVRLIAEILKFTSLQIRWFHFGDGPEMVQLQDACNDLPKNVTCVLSGNVTPDQLFDFYAQTPIDLFLNVSSSEGVPVSIMEALSFGIPVVATDVGGTGELVNTTNGILIPKDFSPSDTGQQLEELLKSKSIQNMRRAARETWEQQSDATKVYPEFITKLTAVFRSTE